MKTLFLMIVGITFAVAHHHLQDFAGASKAFTGDVYKKVIQENNENFLISPLSLQVVLALANIGAKGETSTQLTTALHLPEEKQYTKEIFEELVPLLQANDAYTLATANKIYAQEGFSIKKPFRDVAVNSFKSDIEPVDFQKNTEAAATINNWVADKTHQKIKKLFTGDEFTIDTRAVLLNAMYFKGTWMRSFKKDDTAKRNFYLTKKSYVDVQMMEKTDLINYYDSPQLNARFVELPYKGNDITMVVVLPKEIDGLAAVESRIHEVLEVPRFRMQSVHLRLPKFKIETLTQFNSVLKKLGVVQAFKRNANFEEIFDADEPLYISDVIQKGFIETDEEGTTAAVATGVIMTSYRSMSIPPEPIKFHANHPFIFYLKHKVAGTLFIGRYSKPEGAIVQLNEPVVESD